MAVVSRRYVQYIRLDHRPTDGSGLQTGHLVLLRKERLKNVKYVSYSETERVPSAKLGHCVLWATGDAAGTAGPVSIATDGSAAKRGVPLGLVSATNITCHASIVAKLRSSNLAMLLCFLIELHGRKFAGSIVCYSNNKGKILLL